MFPDSTQPQSGAAAHLPPVQPLPTPEMTVPVSPQLPTPSRPGAQAPAANPAAVVAAQAQRLIQQHSHDPYALSEALQQLKSSYLAEQYHIVSNPTQK